MSSVKFPVSVQSYTLNDSCEVFFSPTDSFFAEKLFNVFSSLAEKNDEYEAEAQKAAGSKEVFEIARTRDAEMREMINSIFEQDVCSALFPGRCVYSMAEGLPEWCNLLLAIMDVMDVTIIAEQKQTNPRVARYTSKYQKYQRK
jgi:hypothetical protein